MKRSETCKTTVLERDTSHFPIFLQSSELHNMIPCCSFYSGCLVVWLPSSQRGRMPTIAFAKVLTLMIMLKWRLPYLLLQASLHSQSKKNMVLLVHLSCSIYVLEDVMDKTNWVWFCFLILQRFCSWDLQQSQWDDSR